MKQKVTFAGQRRAMRERPRTGLAPAMPAPATSRWWRLLRVLVAIALPAGILGALWAASREPTPKIYDYELVNSFPHDTEAYCQGLVYTEGVLYEGTGQYGESSLRKVDLTTGQVQQRVTLDRSLFGEGITCFKNQIIQLTWQNQFGIVYDKQTLAELKRFPFRGEGWGITHDGQYLIVSDGSPNLKFLDPQTFRTIRRITVRSQGQRISQLNELEYVNGQIFANVWHKDAIACISPRSGDVLAWIDLRGLLPASERRDEEAVLNGIAYDAEKDRLFVTGKNWPKLFEIRLKPRP